MRTGAKTLLIFCRLLELREDAGEELSWDISLAKRSQSTGSGIKSQRHRMFLRPDDGTVVVPWHGVPRAVFWRGAWRYVGFENGDGRWWV